jgi:hypothetical protein
MLESDKEKYGFLGRKPVRWKKRLERREKVEVF